MSVKQRLISFLNHVGISQSKFEEKVSLSNGFVNNIGDSIRVKSLNKISSHYPDLNTTWLLTGEGEMLLTGRINKIVVKDTPGTNLTYLIELLAKVNVLFSNEAEKTAKEMGKKATDVLREMNAAVRVEADNLYEELQKKS